jgi:hypothetical protein
VSPTRRSRISTSTFVSATSGGASGVAQFAMVSQKTRQVTTQSTASRFVRRSAVRSLAVSVIRTFQ